MATTVYHGTTISRIDRLARALANGNGIYVTDTTAHAARYANAQATGRVDPDATMPVEHTAIVSIDVDDAIAWTRRAESHQTLDACEAWITVGRIVNIERRECDYRNCTCHPGHVAS